jgi:CDGSH-type Zn-finger protein
MTPGQVNQKKEEKETSNYFPRLRETTVISKMMSQEKIEMLLQEPVILVALIVPILIIVITQFTSKNAIVVDQTEVNKNKRVVNLSIKKSEAKVVDKVDCGEIENLAEFSNGKLVMCRCWRSKTFPYCDGNKTYT